MKLKHLEELFAQFCAAAHLTDERSHKEGDNYILAREGTIYLAAAPRNNWAIMRNSGDGTVSIYYGYVSAERMSGYLEAASAANTSQTHERGKEMAMTACIMTHNFFDEMLNKMHIGVMASYDKIAEWSAEFYDKYRNFNWENMIHADGTACEYPSANAWEDVVIQFTRQKMLCTFY